MATIKERITLELGSLPSAATDSVLDDLIADSLAEVIAELPLSALFSIAETATDSGSGVSIAEKRVLRAYKDSSGIYWAKKVDYLYANDSARTFVATEPYWYELGGTAYIIPSGGTFLMTQALTATTASESITGANRLFYLLVCAKATLHVIRLKFAEIREALIAVTALPTTPTLPSAPSFTYTDATTVGVTATTIASFGTAPVYTGPTLSLDYTDYSTYFDLEDSEIGMLALAKLQKQLESFREEMQDALNDFNDANVEYQATIRGNIEQAGITLQEELSNAQRDDNVDITNRAKQLEQQVVEYQNELARHAEEVRSYQVQVNSAASRVEQGLGLYSGEARGLAFDLQRIQALYKERFLQYTKAYSGAPPVRPILHEY